jgi:hypothetical protein
MDFIECFMVLNIINFGNVVMKETNEFRANLDI